METLFQLHSSVLRVLALPIDCSIIFKLLTNNRIVSSRLSIMLRLFCHRTTDRSACGLYLASTLHLATEMNHEGLTTTSQSLVGDCQSIIASTQSLGSLVSSPYSRVTHHASRGNFRRPPARGLDRGYPADAAATTSTDPVPGIE